MKKHLSTGLVVTSLFLAVAGCSGTQSMTEANTGSRGDATDTTISETARTNSGTARPAGWSDESHGDTADPDYETVFPEDGLNQIKITISPEDWQAMQANMTQLLGTPGAGDPGGRRGGGFAPLQRDQQGQLSPDGISPLPPENGQAGGGLPGGGGFRGGDMTPVNPIWVPATIEFSGQTWTDVGVRYKGNSSLSQAWNSGSSKLGLKLDFDQFEDEHPEIENQRFFGFRQLSLSNNFGDATYMRETVAYDLLEAAGLPAAKTAFYEVILDHGDGDTSLGIYTMVEVIDDTMVDRVFGDDEGNIYEADGPAASLAAGTSRQITTSFQKENNEDEADWSDVQALYDVLHSTERTSNPAAWRTKLEAVFDTGSFLEWLAVTSAIGHWDTYGQMTHNYYLYGDPDTGRLTWISWDHNFVLGAGPGGGQGGPAPGQPGVASGAAGADQAGAPRQVGMGARGSVALDKAGVGTGWPLIRYLLDDPVYKESYTGYLEEARGLLDTEKLEANYQEMASMLAPYAAKESGTQFFESAVESLVQATRDRARAVQDFLAIQ